MNTVLVPINDSSDIECAIKHVIERYRTQPVTLFLLNVQMLSQNSSRVLSGVDRSMNSIRKTACKSCSR